MHSSFCNAIPGISAAQPLMSLGTHACSDAPRRYYITASPQCVYPGANPGGILNRTSFDAVYVQFCQYEPMFPYPFAPLD